MSLGLPSISIQFLHKSTSAIVRGSRGIVALILKDTKSVGGTTINDLSEIPTDLSDTNKDLIEKAFLGNTNAPKKIELFVIDSTESATTNSKIGDATKYFENVTFDYLAFPSGIESDLASIVTFIKSMRDTLGIKCKAVLANSASDYEGIINVTQDDVVVGSTTYTTAQFTARVAGLLAGTDLRVSCTYSELPEVDSIPYESRDDISDAIENGEFVLFKEAGKIKVARGVNSLTTLTSPSTPKSETFQKIKLVDIMDLISNDLRTACRDYYIGKFANSYDNKCLLIVAIRGYLDTLVKEGLIENATADIDLEQQTTYLKQKGVDVADMSESDIRQANTQDKVFIKVTCSLIDAIEDITIKVYI